jgi:putative transposase
VPDKNYPETGVKERPSELLQSMHNGGSIVSDIVKKSAALVLQELMEQEVTEFLGRDHYRRGEKKQGYRNGYEPVRIKTAEGKIEVCHPQVRDTDSPFHSKLAAFFKGNSEILEKLAVEMYARGLSTRDIEDALAEATGDALLSRTAVSNVTEILYQEFEEFQNRDLSLFDVEYFFLDALYESLRARYHVKEAVLCAWAITRAGGKVLLHLASGNKESYENWLDFLRDMVAGGLRIPTAVTTDGAPGLIKAVEVVFPASLRIRCWFHRMQNLQAKVPDEAWPEIKAELIAIRDAAGYEQGKQLAQEFIRAHRYWMGESPGRVKSVSLVEAKPLASPTSPAPALQSFISVPEA